MVRKQIMDVLSRMVCSHYICSLFVYKCCRNSELTDFWHHISSPRIALLKSITGLLIRQKSFGPLATPKGKHSSMYAILFIIVIVIIAIAANMYSLLYTALRSSFDIRIRIFSFINYMMWIARSNLSRQWP